jgi:hypothetical protein
MASKYAERPAPGDSRERASETVGLRRAERCSERRAKLTQTKRLSAGLRGMEALSSQP